MSFLYVQHWLFKTSSLQEIPFASRITYPTCCSKTYLTAAVINLSLLLPAAPTSNRLHKPWWKLHSSHCLWERFSRWPFKQREVLLSSAHQRLFAGVALSGIGKTCWCEVYLDAVSRMSPCLTVLKICTGYALFKTLLFAMFDQCFFGSLTLEITSTRDRVYAKFCVTLLRLVGRAKGLVHLVTRIHGNHFPPCQILLLCSIDRTDLQPLQYNFWPMEASGH